MTEFSILDTLFIKSANSPWLQIDRSPLENEQELTRPIVARAGDMPARQKVSAHQHNWGQIAYASSGILNIELENGRFIVPSDKALWIPKSVMHEISTRYGASFRSLYVSSALCSELSKQPYVFSVNSLLRELILSVIELDTNYEMCQRTQLLLNLLLHEVKQAPVTPLFIPMPKDRRLQLITTSLQQDPRNNTSIEQWQNQVGASSRTLNRLFNQETGMSFVQWRQRVRIAYALELLSQNKQITDVAHTVGYESASAFTTMFKKHLGTSPKHYIETEYPR